jgi:hypothetical protein
MALDPMTDQGWIMDHKEDAEFNKEIETTPSSVLPRPPQASRPRLSASQFIMRASAAVGFLAFSWRLPDIWAATSQLIVRQTTPNLDACPGYSASAIMATSTGLTAQLHIHNDGCNVYGPDLQTLSLTVTYETG